MRLVLLAIQMALVTLPLCADDALGRWMSAESVSSLRAGGTVRRSIPADGSLALLPAVSSQATIADELGSFHPSVGVELARLVGTGKPPMDAPFGWLPLYNTMHAASTMEGTRYWSVSRGREEILFTQSYAVSSSVPAQKIPDPSFSVVPPESRFFTFQEDRSFGKNLYSESFSFPGDHLSVKIENQTTISLAFIPIVKPGGFVVHLVLLPLGGDILFYGAAVLRTTFPVGDRNSREESLANRLTAMTNWLQKQLGTH